jgi:hypothetical protein
LGFIRFGLSKFAILTGSKRPGSAVREEPNQWQVSGGDGSTANGDNGVACRTAAIRRLSPKPDGPLPARVVRSVFPHGAQNGKWIFLLLVAPVAFRLELVHIPKFNINAILVDFTQCELNPQSDCTGTGRTLLPVPQHNDADIFQDAAPGHRYVAAAS